MPTPKKIALTAALLVSAAATTSAQQAQVGLFASSDAPWSTAENFSFERAMEIARQFDNTENPEAQALPVSCFAPELAAPTSATWARPTYVEYLATAPALPRGPELHRPIVWSDLGPTILDLSPSEGTIQQSPAFGAAYHQLLDRPPTLEEQAMGLRRTTPVLITYEATTLDSALTGFPLPSPPVYVPEPRPISLWPEPTEPRWTGWSEGGFAGVEYRVLGSPKRSGLFINAQAGVMGPLDQPLVNTGITIGWSFRQDPWEGVFKF